MEGLFPFPLELKAFVSWLLSAGAGGVITSLLIERTAWFQRLENPKHKALVVMGVFVVTPFLGDALGWALSKLDEATLAVVLYVWNKITWAIVSWGASQYGHASDPARLKNNKRYNH